MLLASEFIHTSPRRLHSTQRYEVVYGIILLRGLTGRHRGILAPSISQIARSVMPVPGLRTTQGLRNDSAGQHKKTNIKLLNPATAIRPLVASTLRELLSPF